MATDVLERLRAADPAAAMPEPDADERERLRRAIVATPLDPHEARRWPRLRGRTLVVLVAGAVLLGGGAVYASGYVGGVFTPSRGTPSQGELAWKFKAGSGVASPTISDGVAYFASRDNHLYAVDAQSGVERWRFKAHGRPQEQRGGYEGSGLYSPAVSDGVVYVGSNNTYLYAIDVQSGQEKWKFKTAGGWPLVALGAQAISGGVVYVANCDDGCLHAVDIQSGQERWQFKTRDHVESSPAVSGGTVYIGSNDGHLYALDARSGQKKWKFKTVGAVESPAISRGVVYFCSEDGHLYAVK